MTAPVPDRDGRPPIVGIDLGAGRAWSAAVALYRNGRVEALAVAPGIPGLPAQEKRDRVPPGTYVEARPERRSARCRRVAGAAACAALERRTGRMWGVPGTVICDLFRLPELRDATKGAATLVPRRARWSEASSDIRGLRKLAGDGPLCVDSGSRALLSASLAGALVAADDAGNVRMVKRGTNNTSRDDVAAALVLAAGELARVLARPRPAFPPWAEERLRTPPRVVFPAGTLLWFPPWAVE